jgi:hypothetical protein
VTASGCHRPEGGVFKKTFTEVKETEWLMLLTAGIGDYANLH